MASNIDITKPVAGAATTQSVRDNFGAARAEIEALQAAAGAAQTDATAALANAATANTAAGAAQTDATAALANAATANTAAGAAQTDATAALANAATANTAAGAAQTDATAALANAATANTAAGAAQTDATAALAAAAAAAAGMPINSISAAYTMVLADAGKTLYHPPADATARVWTIDSSANVAYPVGTVIAIDNDIGAGVLTISIAADTLVLIGAAGSTGNRTLAAGGRAVAQKVSTTRWRITGTGLT